jgi:hypothetical protein
MLLEENSLWASHVSESLWSKKVDAFFFCIVYKDVWPASGLANGNSTRAAVFNVQDIKTMSPL